MECSSAIEVAPSWGLQDALRRTAFWYCSRCDSLLCKECKKTKHDGHQDKRQHVLFHLDDSDTGNQHSRRDTLLSQTFDMCKDWYQSVVDEKERLSKIYKGLIDVASKAESDSPTLGRKCLQANLRWESNQNLGHGPEKDRVYFFEPWASDRTMRRLWLQRWSRTSWRFGLGAPVEAFKRGRPQGALAFSLR